VEEAGGPAGLEVDSWLALLAPRGTPPEVVRRVNADVNKVLADPDMLARMQLLGFEPFPLTPGELAELIRTDTAKYADLVRRTGASAD
jgi:tripartite-type tricarboxylate transporter receptor subunit TctC